MKSNDESEDNKSAKKVNSDKKVKIKKKKNKKINKIKINFDFDKNNAKIFSELRRVPTIIAFGKVVQKESVNIKKNKNSKIKLDISQVKYYNQKARGQQD